MTGEDPEDEEAATTALESVLSRREMLGIGAVGAGLLAYTSDPRDPQAGVAQAQTGSEPLIQLGDKYEIDEDSNNDLIIRHVDNGEVLKYDASADKFSSSKDFTEITTDQTTIGSVGNATPDLLTTVDITNDDQFEKQIQETDTVGTSATTILQGILNNAAAWVVVHGTASDGSNNTRFIDIVICARGSSPTTVGSNGEASAEARTYSRNFDDLQLAMASTDHDVLAYGYRMISSTSAA